jgi:hypothetical protein
VLRPGRHYRLLLVVNVVSGATSDVELEQTLSDEGFQDAAVTAPSDWSEALSAELAWPDEPTVETAANEALVRAKGAYFSHRAELFDRDRPIVGGEATYTIAACWDCGPAQRAPGSERVGQQAADRVETPQTSKLVALGILGTILGGGWLLSRAGQKEAAQEEAMHKLEQKRERVDLEERIAGYLAGGASHEQAEKRAEREIAAEAARQLASDLEQGGELT